MDLIQIIIELIVKAMSGSKPTKPTASNPNDLVKQIQARIEAARLQALRLRRPNAPGPMRAQLPPKKKPQPVPRQLKKQKRRAVPTTLFNPPTSVPSVKAPATPVTPPPAPRPAVVNVDAKVLARWLKPQTLRAQFVLTEIFQPPIALRDSHLL